jgi:glutathione S-transferase
VKLRHSPNSPYVRKVVAFAIETGLRERIELVPTDPWAADTDLAEQNPLGKVPTLIADEEGMTLFGSTLICEYLDGLHDSPPLFPPSGRPRWLALRRVALADGILDAAVLRNVERNRRPEEKRWADWERRQANAVRRALDALEAEAGDLAPPATIDQIAVACALGYLDFRFAGEDWRTEHPNLAGWFADFAERPSLRETAPPVPA